VHAFHLSRGRYPAQEDTAEILSIAQSINEQAKAEGTESVENIEEKIIINTAVYSTSSICA